VGISYFGRTYQQGKKIGWKDGLRAIYCIVKYNLESAEFSAIFWQPVTYAHSRRATAR